jgi:hypothetical protein
VSLASHAQPLSPPGMFGGSEQDTPDDWEGTATGDSAAPQDRTGVPKMVTSRDWATAVPFHTLTRDGKTSLSC